MSYQPGQRGLWGAETRDDRIVEEVSLWPGASQERRAPGTFSEEEEKQLRRLKVLVLLDKMSEAVDVSSIYGFSQPTLIGASAVSLQHIQRAVEFKIYPTARQAVMLESWLRICCWLYNQALDQRMKAHKRRKENVGLYDQQVWLTIMRGRIPSLAEVPAQFERDALRRVDRGFQAFFRRCKAGEKKLGYPRFRSHTRYRSLEALQPAKYIRSRTLYVPGIGHVRARGQFGSEGKQQGIRIIRRAAGWYGLVIVKREKLILDSIDPINVCGVDLGLNSFATLDSGEKIKNPRLFRRAESKLRIANKRLSRRQKGSKRREKAKKERARVYEKVTRQRKGFCHRISRDLVNRFDGIALEDLNFKSLAGSRLAKSIRDAAWGMFARFLTYKAENAGRHAVAVDSRGTSQECPTCGRIVPKKLSERIHHCPDCGLTIDRDQAAAMVIRNRAFRRGRGDSISPSSYERAESMKRKV